MSTESGPVRPGAPPHNLHIVSGKGGTGKTTIAGALACALATAGRRVLVCEVEGRHALSELFGVPAWEGAEEKKLRSTPAGGTVHGLAIDAEDALLEYLETFYHLGIAGKALDRFGVIDFATSIAPGLRDVLLTGKVYEAVRREVKNLPNAYDAVVLDAPPTGRIAQFLNVHEAVAGLARVGPIRNQADSIMRVLRSDRTVVHLVTLLEDMPVTETGDAVRELAPTKIEVADVITNMITPRPLPLTQLRRAARHDLPLEVPGFDPAENKALAAEFALDAERVLAEADCRRRLTELGLPVVDIALDPAGVDDAALLGIAEALAEQLPHEVAA
ncbi:anion-transporting ArsA/GET3 family ATPase [Friedmanniella endophytica]|uniref:Anion-transporting ArsA/GET3 family ATPase n=1 Tax=Microlunatus kandeliicorticis TaxID=1759536 RepID=A0A7W3IRL1_9ACTN|nr:ArsA-related P-loop ATPase [Microlunatus kandeliicorticis]MBA8793976.1 anion-transporting ArsA/GET3 family ATPase [Microlunatus kandeliicorticis]